MSQRKTGRIDFDRITLSITGTMASTKEYEILRTPDGLLATMYDGSWNYNDNIRREDCQISQGIGVEKNYKEMAEILYRLGVDKWDGFIGSNPHVLDGELFSLEIILADGKRITAHGNNAYPKNYREFLKCVDAAGGTTQVKD